MYYYINDYANMTIIMNNEPRNQYEIQSENLLVFMPHLFKKSLHFVRIVEWNEETCSILFNNYKTLNAGNK